MESSQGPPPNSSTMYIHPPSRHMDVELRRRVAEYVKSYVGNDPLEPWLLCIKWLKEFDPPGSAQSVLREVLEVCARNFVADNRYKSDIRYLRVWIQYTDCCSDRGPIFPFLEANGIGVEHGLFYEAYATLLEHCRDFQKADLVFQSGISRQAQPLERLIGTYNNFRIRMNMRQRRKLRQEQEQRALFARSQEGAQRPLVDNYGGEGAITSLCFQNPRKEDSFLDMQDNAGDCVGSAPVNIGSRIYEGTVHKGEASFEEERLRHWVQHQARQLHSTTSGSDVYRNNRLNMSTSLQRGEATGLIPMYQSPYRTGLIADSRNHIQQGQNQEIFVRNLASVSNLSQAVPFTTRQPVVNTNSTYSLPAIQRVSHVTTTSVRSFTKGHMVCQDLNATSVETPCQSEAPDLTINTKTVTDDILAMFSGPLACENSRPGGQSSSFRTNAACAGSQECKTSLDQGPRAPVSLSHPDDKTLRSGIVQSRLSSHAHNNSHFIGFNGVVEQDLAAARVQHHPAQVNVVTGGVGFKDIRSELLACGSSRGSGSEAQMYQDMAVTLHNKDGDQSNISVRHLAPVHKDLKPAAVRQWIRLENGNSTHVDNTKPDVGLVQNHNIYNEEWRSQSEDTLDASNVSAITSMKRPAIAGPLGTSGSASKTGTQSISIDDAENPLDSRDCKRQKVEPPICPPSIEDPGVREPLTTLKERSEVKKGQPHTLQESQEIGLKKCTSVPELEEEPFPSERNFLKSTPSSTELRKPGGKVYPWDLALIANFLRGLQPPLSHYEGYLYSSKKYCGKVSVASLKSGVKNKILELGGSRYQLRGCTGKGAFAQVYLAEVLDKRGGSGDRVVLKVQKPPCPWEFYIYRQLDLRIPCEKRCSFGRAQNIHVYADCSFMECDFGEYGTLQDVVNAYRLRGQRMDEVVCIFYTIELLDMLENLHRVGLIHGDFKPDNLLIRSTSQTLINWTPDMVGSWKQQGVSLIDWGRSIDLSLFAEGTEFVGDSKTEGFRCIEMLEKNPWTFQVDTYGLCGVVHFLLHASYMEIEKRSTDRASEPIYRPKAPYKRYWNIELWQKFFDTLLNLDVASSIDTLSALRKSFEVFLKSDSGLLKKLRESLTKQNTMLLTRK